MPLAGLVLFGVQTYWSIEQDHRQQSETRHYLRYFMWSSLKLDRSPATIDPPAEPPCNQGQESCVGWDPGEIHRPIDPLAKVVVLTGIPAFLLSALTVGLFSRFGISQVFTFMIGTPIFLTFWYWFLGWLTDRKVWKKQLTLR